MTKRRDLEARVERIERAADAFRWELANHAQTTEYPILPGAMGHLGFVNAMFVFAEMMKETP